MSDEPLPVLDTDVLDDLRDSIGDATFDRVIQKFAVELGDRFATIAFDVDPMRLARDAHAMIAASGSLGFAQLSRDCRAAELTCLEGGDTATAIRQLQESTRLALRTIAALPRTGHDMRRVAS